MHALFQWLTTCTRILPVLRTSQIAVVPDAVAVSMLDKLVREQKLAALVKPPPTRARLQQMGWQVGRDCQRQYYYRWPGRADWVRKRARVMQVLQSLGAQVWAAALGATDAQYGAFSKVSWCMLQTTGWVAVTEK